MSAGSTIGTLFNILMVGAVWAILAFVVVKLNTYANTMALSQDAMNTIYFLEIGFLACLPLILVAYLINNWITAKNESNQMV